MSQRTDLQPCSLIYSCDFCIQSQHTVDSHANILLQFILFSLSYSKVIKPILGRVHQCAKFSVFLPPFVCCTVEVASWCQVSPTLKWSGPKWFYGSLKKLAVVVLLLFLVQNYVKACNIF